MRKQSKTKPSSQTANRTSIANKLATMANAAEMTSASDAITMNQLVAELDKQRASLKGDLSTLIQESVATLHSSVKELTETVNGVQDRLEATESLAGDNFAALNTLEKRIQALEKQNKLLLDRVDDLENRSRRNNLRILNVPEGSEKGQSTIQFVSQMLMEVIGEGTLDKPPELERAHRSLGEKPPAGQPPRPFVVCFNRFQEKETILRWARAHKPEFNGSELRFFPDMSANVAKKRAAFKGVKQLLWEKKIRFHLRYPALLRVHLNDETLDFATPKEAQEFYDTQIATQDWTEPSDSPTGAGE